MILLASLLWGACGRRAPAPALIGDTVFGIRVGMPGAQVEARFRPRGAGKWLEMESVAGESRLRWSGADDQTAPVSVDVAIGTDGEVRELVFSLRAADGEAALAGLGVSRPQGLTRYQGPSGEVIVAPGLGAWTIRLLASGARDVGR
jgi:hypothetical protein